MSFRRLMTAAIRRGFLPNRDWRPRRLLRIEQLEDREVPSVTLIDIPDQNLFNDRPLYLPVTPSNEWTTRSPQASSARTALFSRIPASMFSSGKFSFGE